jgi:hypothetical protein
MKIVLFALALTVSICSDAVLVIHRDEWPRGRSGRG